MLRMRFQGKRPSTGVQTCVCWEAEWTRNCTTLLKVFSDKSYYFVTEQDKGEFPKDLTSKGRLFKGFAHILCLTGFIQSTTSCSAHCSKHKLPSNVSFVCQEIDSISSFNYRLHAHFGLSLSWWLLGLSLTVFSPLPNSAVFPRQFLKTRTSQPAAMPN